MSTYTSIRESEVSKMGFEVDLGFFFLSSSHSRVLSSGAVLCSVTPSVTKLGTPDIHPPDSPLQAVDFSLSHFPEEHVGSKRECLPWDRARVAPAPLEQPVLSLSVMWAEVRDACVVPRLSFASITSAAVWTNLCES